MSSADKNLSHLEGTPVGSAAPYKFGIVYAAWHHQVTGALLEGAKKTLLQYGADANNLVIKEVPGTFELTLGAQYLAEMTPVDAIICIGCVIQGETKHFDFICDAVAKGITNLNVAYRLPVIFGVLTPNTMEQAMDRAGGKHGNKGDEAAITAIKMLELRDSFKSGNSVGFKR